MTKAKLILVVEDDRDIQSSLIEILRTSGFEAEGANNGQEALAFLQKAQHLPSLILLDLMMPIMDGWQFREQQALDSRISGIPVVVISAGGNVEQKAQNLSASGWLRKPLQINDLLKVVEKSILP